MKADQTDRSLPGELNLTIMLPLLTNNGETLRVHEHQETVAVNWGDDVTPSDLRSSFAGYEHRSVAWVNGRAYPFSVTLTGEDVERGWAVCRHAGIRLVPRQDRARVERDADGGLSLVRENYAGV